MVESISAADAFLLGRKTYEIFAGYWPRVTDEDNPIATRLNTRPKYVASRTLERVEWNNTTLLQGDVADAVAELKRQPGGELQVQGSADLVQTLLRHHLVDEYRLLVYPVVLGKGKRLFGDGSVPAALRLVDTKTIASGVVVHTYESAGEPTFGSFADDD
jgi:dihydrofolate reductase